jgi:tetratricopeptide (TPR) repeat protein
MSLVGDRVWNPRFAPALRAWREGVAAAAFLAFITLTTSDLRAQTITDNSPDSSADSPPSATTWSGMPPDTNIVQNFNVITNLLATNAADMTNPLQTNAPTATASSGTIESNSANARLEMAMYYVNRVEPEKAEPLLVGLLDSTNPVPIQKSALFELGTVVASESDLPRAQSIYGQYLEKWPDDVKVPEILLRQGQIFRRMGLNELALGKFYSVMTSALSLKGDQMDYYRTLVLQTQVEIAETHYLIGQFADAADFYARLLLNTDPALNRSQIKFRLVRSLAIIGHNEQAIAEAQDFITRYPDADQIPEVRYYLAECLKAIGQKTEALQQVLLCLREQRSKTTNNPEVWAYWQQRIGNEIANQLYHEGEYLDALQIYDELSQLDTSAEWQVPVEYQVGVTYEKLSQPEKAVETYNAILSRQADAGTNASSALQSVFEMARWRLNFVQWQTNAEAVDHSFVLSKTPPAAVTTNLQTSLNP